MAFRDLSRVLRPGAGPLAGLQEHARWLRSVEERLHRLLPADMAAQVRVANLSRDTLTVLVATPAWGTRLRFLEPRILEWLRAEPTFRGVARIKVRVRTRPAAPPPGEHHPTAHPRCPGAAAALGGVATGEDHPALARSLRRLARRLGDTRD